ncbi:MAG: aminopeptidase, partial [Raoultibacter sp.]
MAIIDSQFEENLERYAQLIIEAGCNLQSGQELFLSAPVQTSAFAQLLTRIAYEHGARHVTVEYYDEKISRMHYEYCELEVFETVPEWTALLNNSMVRKGAAVLSIISDDPEAMTGIDPTKAAAKARASRIGCKEFYDALNFGNNVWCIAGAASPIWAQKVFPGITDEEATQKLWDAIFTTARVYTDDPIAAWEDHRSSFAARIEQLNAHHFSSLHFSNASGTNFTVGLPKKHLWNGGGDTTKSGTTFFPNIPTEEIFTSPDRLQADG